MQLVRREMGRSDGIPSLRGGPGMEQSMMGPTYRRSVLCCVGGDGYGSEGCAIVRPECPWSWGDKAIEKVRKGEKSEEDI